MFDFAWSEIVLIGAVALIAIGPKDMPAAIRTVSSMIKKARRMAAEFQTHVDEMVREADLGDVKKAFSDIRNLNVAGALEKHIDPDRSIRNTFAEDPFKPTYPTATAARDEVIGSAGDTVTGAAPDEITVATRDELALPAPYDSTAALTNLEPVVQQDAAFEPPRPMPPAFIPPSMLPPWVARPAAPPPEAPPFIPPEAVLQRHPKA